MSRSICLVWTIFGVALLWSIKMSLTTRQNETFHYMSAEQEDQMNLPTINTSGTSHIIQTRSIHPTTNNNNISICFLTVSYAPWASQADQVQNVSGLFHDESNVHFFLYTNLPRLAAPGWTKVVERDLRRKQNNYSRLITYSRKPKFLGWKFPEIRQHCQVVFYLDAIGDLISTSQLAYQQVAAQVLQSTVGLAQYPHRGGGGAAKEFRRILFFHKDIPENVNRSLAWLHSRPDYNPNCTLYENRYFAYAVHSLAFQRASQFFWDRYSQEVDSWRDQPLWCYTLDHFGIQPIPLPHKELFQIRTFRMGKKKHKYGVSSLGDAVQAQEARDRQRGSG